MSLRDAVLVISIAAASTGAAAPAPSVEVPLERQAMILARCIAYERNLATRARSEVVVGILFKPATPASQKASESTKQAFRVLERMTIKGLPVRSVLLPFDTPSKLDTTLDAQAVDAVYVCDGFNDEVGAMTWVFRKHRVLSMGALEKYVTQGLSLGVFSIDGRPVITVNFNASREEGVLFDSDLLRLAKVIR